MISDKKSPPFKIELNNCGVPVIVPVGDRTPAEARAWAAKAAGLTESEMRDDPEHGLLISLSGVRKLAAMAPDTGQKLEFIAWLQAEFPQRP